MPWATLVSAVVVGVIVTQGQASAQLYTEVAEWPMPAQSAAGTPTAWNFGQIVAVATGEDVGILVLHRGAHAILTFDTVLLFFLSSV